MLGRLETKIVSPSIGNESSDTCDIQNHILDLKELLRRERTDYHVSKLIYICCLSYASVLSYGTWSFRTLSDASVCICSFLYISVE